MKCYNLVILLSLSVAVAGQIRRPIGIAQDRSFRRRFQSFCENGMCKRVNKQRLMKLYQGLFLSETEIDKKLTDWAKNHRAQFGNQRPDSFFSVLCRNPYFQIKPFCINWKNANQDFDLCCPSQFYHLPNDTLTNIDGIDKMLVKFTEPAMQQFVPHATCLAGGACFKGLGVCRTDTITIYLLVVDITGGFPFCKFDEFEVPAYCSCKTN